MTRLRMMSVTVDLNRVHPLAAPGPRRPWERLTRLGHHERLRGASAAGEIFRKLLVFPRENNKNLGLNIKK